MITESEYDKEISRLLVDWRHGMDAPNDKLETDAKSEFGWLKSGYKIHHTESIAITVKVDIAIVEVGDAWHGMRKNEDGDWYNFLACNAENYDDAVNEAVDYVRSQFNAKD